MKEEFIHYAPGAGNDRFRIELAGSSFCDGSYRIQRADPDLLVAEYILQGEGTIRIDGQILRAKAGDVYLLPPGKSHLYASDAEDPWQKLWFNASGTLVKLLLAQYNPSQMVVFQDADAGAFFTQIHAIGRSTCDAAQKHEQAAIVFHQLLQHLHRHSICEHSYARETARIKAYIDEHFTGTIRLEELGQLVYLSPSQVVRAFKRDIGITPYEYCLQLKIDYGCTLLRSTNLRIREVSAMLGFCDEHYFCSIFKEKTGTTPTQYRKNQQ